MRLTSTQTSPMTFPLTREDVSLIVEALQLIGNDAASSLKKRLLSHYSVTDQHTPSNPAPVNPHVPYGPNCPRRGGPLVAGARWTMGENTARSSNVSAEAIIGSIASFNASQRIDLISWISSILGAIKGVGNEKGSGLPSLVERCRTFSGIGVGWSFMTMISRLQLAAICLSTIRSHPSISTLTEFYDDMIKPLESKPAQSTFFFWISSGVKFMLLAGGGTIYVLILIAAKDMRWSITTAPANVSWEVAKMLRSPDTCAAPEMQSLIQRKIIPVITRLREHLPLSMNNVLNSISPQLDCTCIRDSDRFIDSVPINNYQLPKRSSKYWNACYMPCWEETISLENEITGTCLLRQVLPTSSSAPPPAPIIPSVASESSSVIRISTRFDRDHPNNVHFPGSRDRVKNLLWTIEQRRIVEDEGMVMRDIDELKEKISTFYPGGIKRADTFLLVPMSIIPGALDIRNSDGSLMALICTSMPSSMRLFLFWMLRSAFDGLEIFKDRTVTSVSEESQDSEEILQAEANEPFTCTHFSHWNRYGLTGHTAPQNVHPHQLEAAGGRRTNLGQTLPYASRETFTQEQLYLNIQANFGEVFEWIEEEISHHLPDEYKVLVKLVDILPNAEGSPVRPFLSLVVNINVCTVAHRDAKDFELCLVLAVGEFTGGGLVMREQGLVAELRNGDFAIFRSGETTHFNLDYLGKRASLVLHTDGGFETWEKDRNGWKDHPYFKYL